MRVICIYVFIYVCAFWRSICIEIFLAKAVVTFRNICRSSTFHPPLLSHISFLQLPSTHRDLFPARKKSGMLFKNVINSVFFTCLKFRAVGCESRSESALRFVSEFVFNLCQNLYSICASLSSVRVRICLQFV